MAVSPIIDITAIAVAKKDSATKNPISL